MNAAIAELTNALEIAETNEPINRASGNVEQADAEAKNAADFRQALALLNIATKGPIWPRPSATPIERERCAKICEDMRPHGGRAWTEEQHACYDALTDAAKNIRGG